MPRTLQSPDPITTLRTRLRLAEQGSSDVVLAVESLRAALRQAAAAVGDLPRDRPSPAVPAPPSRPVSPSPASVSPRFLRFKEVGLMCGMWRTTILRMQREGKFPERRRIGPNAVRWLAEDVEEWIRSRERRL